MEDTLDPLTVPPKLFNPDAMEVAKVFKGAILFSRYAFLNLLTRRLHVHFTKKCKRVNRFPLVGGNSIMDPNLGLHFLVGVHPPVD